MVRTYWGVPSEAGLMSCSRRDKLKALKLVLKMWNNEVFGNMEFKITRCVDGIEH